MIDFMLQEFRQIAFGFDGLRLPAAVLIGHADACSARHTHHQIRKAEAIVPQLEALRAAPDDRRVDERVSKSRWLHADEDDPFERADLRRSDAAPEARALTKARKRF